MAGEIAEGLSALLGATTSGLAGGVAGLVSSIGGQIANYFHTKSEREFQEKKWSHEERLHTLNNEKDIQDHNQDMALSAQESEQALKLTRMTGSYAGLNTSIDADKSIGDSYLWVNAVKSLFRPFLTTMLWIISIIVFFTTYEAPEVLVGNVVYMVESIYFATGTATFWWFGDRSYSPREMKNV